MENILTLAGLALTATFSFSLAVLLGWTTLAGLLRLLPVSATRFENARPERAAAPVALASARPRRIRVVVAAAKNRSGKVYSVRTA